MLITSTCDGAVASRRKTRKPDSPRPDGANTERGSASAGTSCTSSAAEYPRGDEPKTFSADLRSDRGTPGPGQSTSKTLEDAFRICSASVIGPSQYGWSARIDARHE